MSDKLKREMKRFDRAQGAGKFKSSPPSKPKKPTIPVLTEDDCRAIAILIRSVAWIKASGFEGFAALSKKFAAWRETP